MAFVRRRHSWTRSPATAIRRSSRIWSCFTVFVNAAAMLSPSSSIQLKASMAMVHMVLMVSASSRMGVVAECRSFPYL